MGNQASGPWNPGAFLQRGTCFSLLPVFVLVLLGCGSSSPSGGSTQTVYAEGRVITPDSTGVPDAPVRTDPLVTATRTDQSGRFRIFEPLTAQKYTFIARRPGEGGVEGRTKVLVPGKGVKKTVYIVLGREISLEAVDIDSVRASPTGPGRKRSGGGK
jgi:hypothetical protein